MNYLKRLADLGFPDLISYQTFHNLQPTGELDLVTKRSLEIPRFCGRPEFEELGEGLPRWGKKILTYGFANLLPNITKEDTIRAFQLAWDRWATVCDLRASHVKSAGDAIDLLISFGRIDGPSSTLAYSQLPGNGTVHQLLQKYDSAESWVIANNAATIYISLPAVAGHEIGHAIGINHLSPGNLMAATHNPAIYEPQPGDITEGIRRYGPPVIVPPTSPPPADGDFQLVKIPKAWLVS